MAVTLAGFAGVQLAWPSWVRPHLLTPLRSSAPLDAARISFIGDNNGQVILLEPFSKPGAWVLSNQTVSPAGQLFTGPLSPACKGPSWRACQAAIGRLHLRQVVSYQPASRFWAFQWYETAIFLALAVALAGFCAWWITHRRMI